MDKLRFYEAKTKAALNSKAKNGIGTLDEKTVHSVLKYYFEPFDGNHEQKIGNYVADIVGENGIIEVQTKNFTYLRPKLTEFLKYSRVTVVYPVITEKNIICFDNLTGEVFSKRKSPLKGNKYTVLDELVKIPDFLLNPKLTLCIVFLKADEYRIPCENAPKNKKRRKKYASFDKIPTDITDEVYLNDIYDYLSFFLPENIPDEFTTKDLEISGINKYTATLMANVFYKAKILNRTGKKERRYLYTKNENDSQI